MGSIELWNQYCATVCSYAASRAATAAEARGGCDRGGDGGGCDNGGGNSGDGDGGDSSGRGDGAAKVRRQRPSAAGCTARMLLCALPTQQTVCMIVHVVRCAPSPPWLLRETATDSITKMGNFDRSKLACPFHRFEIRASDAPRGRPCRQFAKDRMLAAQRHGTIRIPESHAGYRGDVKRTWKRGKVVFP